MRPRREYPRAARDFSTCGRRTQFAEQTKYLDEALHADARHERVSPPLLGSKIRNDMLRAFLRPGARRSRRRSRLRQRARAAVEPRSRRRRASASTSARSSRARTRAREVDLLLGDLRRLPFADGTFTKAWSLDVLEHLSPEALRGMLAEADARARARRRAVRLHPRAQERADRGRPALDQRARARLERVGLIDMRQERLRKSDHLNPLRDVPTSSGSAPRAGFRIARIRYYTPLVGGFVENILMRMAERAMARRAAGASAHGERHGRRRRALIREARTAAKAQIARRPDLSRVLQALSMAMKLDLLLFGRITSGPFFALLVKDGAPAARRSMKVLYCAIDQTVPGTKGGSVHVRRSPKASRRSGTTSTCS